MELTDNKVNGVEELHNSTEDLYNNVVVKGENSAEGMIDELNNGIKVLKNTWHGIDAGENIQAVVKIHNQLVKVRNALAKLATESSKVASDYRNIQIANGARLDAFDVLTSTDKIELEDYSDTKDTIDIVPEAEQGKNSIQAVASAMDVFVANVKTKYDEIMNNWIEGPGRDVAKSAFEEFLNDADANKKTLNDVADRVDQSIKNYAK